MRFAFSSFLCAIACSALLFVAGCNTSLPYEPSIKQAVSYTLGAGDVITLTVAGESELDGEYTVDDKGYVDLPLIGSVLVNGLSIQKSDLVITDMYRDGYLKDPNISIQVKEYRPFFILGEVRNPGKYPYKDGMTVLQAVAVAGGFTYRADQKQVEIVRVQKTLPNTSNDMINDGENHHSTHHFSHHSSGMASANKDTLFRSKGLSASILPGDSIYIKERLF